MDQKVLERLYAMYVNENVQLREHVARAEVRVEELEQRVSELEAEVEGSAGA